MRRIAIQKLSKLRDCRWKIHRLLIAAGCCFTLAGSFTGRTAAQSPSSPAGRDALAIEDPTQKALENAIKNFGPGTPGYGKPFLYSPPGDPPTLNQDVPSESTALPLINEPQVIANPQPAPMRVDPSFSAEMILPPAPEPLIPVNRVTWVFNFQEAPWMTVLKSFAKFSGLALIVDQPVTGTFTYFDDRPYPMGEALDVLNDHLIRQGRLLVRNENKLTLIAAGNSFRDGTVPFVHVSAIPALGRNELVSVAFPLSGSTPAQIVPELQQLLSPLGNVLPLTNSNRVVVTDTGSSLRRLYDLMRGSGLASSDVSIHVIHLNNTTASEVASAVNQRLGYGSAGSAGGGGGIQPVSGFDSFGAGAAQAGGAGASGGGAVGVVAEPLTNTLLIEGTPEEISRIDSLVRQIDRDPGQVTIQALLVEVLLGNTNEFGVELGFQDSVLFDRSVIDNVVSIAQTATAPNGVQTTDQTILSQTAQPGFAFNGAPLGNNTTINPSSVGRQGISNLGLGRVSGDLGFGGLVLSAGSNSVNVLLRALAEKHKVDVLSRPHIRTVNNREALIQIGQQVPVIDGVTISPNGLANPVVRQDQAGIILRVIPRISVDGSVQIEVQAEKSAYQLVAGSGVPIFTDASTGNVIEAPVKDITTAQTTITALSGQTIVLGGLITRDESVVERKVPWLGDIPLLGRLFRVDLNQTNRKELLIFLTPTIVNTALESDCITAAEAERITLRPNPAIDLHRDFMRAFEGTREASPGHEPMMFEPNMFEPNMLEPSMLEPSSVLIE